MSSTQRIDDIINGIEPEEVKEIQSEANEGASESPEIKEVPRDERESSEVDTQEDSGEKSEKAAKDISAKPDSVENATSEDTDEYGLEVPKARTYTEDEVQRMIRDRLSRGQHAQPAVQHAAAQDFQVDPNSDQPWEQQLESFVKGTIEKVNRETQTREYQRQEAEVQSKFEVKFTMGMEKFGDFKEVVGQMPITDSMMMAIRDMDNPATFIYAAAKMQPEEVKRIAALTDPFQQAKEMGRLDERMRKAKNISRTAVPLKSTKGDMAERSSDKPKYSIDNLIDKHAKSRRK